MAIYRLSAKGLGILGEDDTVTRHHNRRKDKTRLVPAPWSFVIVISIVYAIGINMVRVLWNESFGRPEIFVANPEVQAEYDRVMGFTDPERKLKLGEDPLKSAILEMKK